MLCQEGRWEFKNTTFLIQLYGIRGLNEQKKSLTLEMMSFPIWFVLNLAMSPVLLSWCQEQPLKPVKSCRWCEWRAVGPREEPGVVEGAWPALLMRRPLPTPPSSTCQRHRCSRSPRGRRRRCSPPPPSRWRWGWGRLRARGHPPRRGATCCLRHPSGPRRRGSPSTTCTWAKCCTSDCSWNKALGRHGKGRVAPRPPTLLMCPITSARRRAASAPSTCSHFLLSFSLSPLCRKSPSHRFPLDVWRSHGKEAPASAYNGRLWSRSQDATKGGNFCRVWDLLCEKWTDSGYVA